MLVTDLGFVETACVSAAQDTQVRELLWLPSEDPTEPAAAMTSFHALATTLPAPPEVPQLCSTDVAQIVYTSGTEAMPKNAMLTHDAVLWQYASCAIDASIASDDVLLHALPLYHCAQLDVQPARPGTPRGSQLRVRAD